MQKEEELWWIVRLYFQIPGLTLILFTQDVTSSALLGKKKNWLPHALKITEEHNAQWQSFYDLLSKVAYLSSQCYSCSLERISRVLLAEKTKNQLLAKMRLSTAAQVSQLSTVCGTPIYFDLEASLSTVKPPPALTPSTWSLKATTTRDANPSKGKLLRHSHLLIGTL
jgi:hypothetical protein